MLEALGAGTVQVREPEDLEGIDGLILPGGESTTMSKMLVRWGLIDPIRKLMADGLPVYGTCAGLILLANTLVEWDDLPRPGGLDITVARNAYGRQIDSFDTALEMNVPGAPEFDTPFEGVFIRAPQIVTEAPGAPLGRHIQVLGTLDGRPVLIRQGHILGGSFHPELTGDSRIHAWFLREMVGSVVRSPVRTG